MATSATLAIQRDRYASLCSQAIQDAEVQKYAQLQAELQKARATQQAAHNLLRRKQAEREKEIADQDGRLATMELDQQRLDIFLQGFAAISEVLNNISYTSAVVMGFASMSFVIQATDNTGREIRYLFWGLALLCIKFLVHSVFLATLAVTDATKLCYQGTKGQDDVRNAFHGLMALRSDVFWNFMLGFITFIVLMVCLVWVKIEQDTAERPIPTDLIGCGIVISVVGWFVPVVRLVRSFRSTRRAFRIEYDAPAPGSDEPGELELAVGPQSLRKRAEARRANRADFILSQLLHSATLSPEAETKNPGKVSLAQASLGYRAAVSEAATQAAPNPFAGPEGRVAFFRSLSEENRQRVLELCGRPWRPGGAARPGEEAVTTFANLSDYLQWRGLRRWAESLADAIGDEDWPDD
eukprot:Hpha_TRINITY_DN20898_c0_g1::TRINITY_DN20898_c0_g1_i1::g.85604::m.85604